MLCVYVVAFSQPNTAQMQNNNNNNNSVSSFSKPKTVRYDLYVSDTLVSYTGKKKQAIAINGSIPAPALNFTEGDTAEIYVHNTLNTETSIHWHGLILPNKEDGVPYLTTAPIEAGQTHLFKFPIVQNGTYWYHSHTKLQEQVGMYGAFIIHKRNEAPIKEYTMVLSDWTDENPDNVYRKLKNATDWYAIKKGSTQNYAEAIKEGHFKTKVGNEWKRLLAMDVSDVAYDRFLINGKSDNVQAQFKAGDKVRLRIINGASSTYFWLKFGGGKLSVVANDGMDVEPVEVDRMIIAVAETYDVVVTIPDNGSYEFLATSEDRTKHASLWLGAGTKKTAVPLPKLKYFEGMKMMNGMTKISGNLDTSSGMQMTNQVMDMNTVMYPEITGEAKPSSESKKGGMEGMEMSKSNSSDIVTLNYGMLRSPVKTTLANAPTKEIRMNLTGNMNRYVWSIDNKTVSEADKILIKKGENVRIILYNGTMMRHPMHLHGHFFRVLNGQGEYSPLKNVLDIMPMETDTLEFAAAETQDWFFHCHILYHMMSGMGRIFSYENSAPNPEIPNPKLAQRKLFADDRAFHAMAQIGLESNGSDGELAFGNTRYKLQTEWRIGLNSRMGYETETRFGRYIGKMQYLFPYIGFDYRYRTFMSPEGKILPTPETKDYRSALTAGVQYTLPSLVVAEARIDMYGKFRFQLSREDIPVTSRLRMNLYGNSDKEYRGGLRYIMTKNFSLSTHYDSDMGVGAGVTITY